MKFLISIIIYIFINLLIDTEAIKITPGKIDYNVINVESNSSFHTPPILKKSRTPISRIHGGDIVNINQREHFNYQIWLQSEKVDKPGFVSTCGGSLIATNWVITAAHCLWSKNNKAVTTDVLFGIINLTDESYEIRTVKSTEYYIHPEWNPSEQTYHDIALMKLLEPIQLNGTDKIGTVAVATRPCKEYYGKTVIISGWGRVDNIGTKVADLKQAEVKVADDKECSEAYPRRKMNYDEIICASGKNNVAACKGDSGGPMVYRDPITLKRSLVGLTSFGSGGCEGSAPGVFTCVPGFLDWIRKTTGLKFA